MKKLILITVSVLYLSSSTELHELLRIPQLLAHYAQHRLGDPHLSLLDFLALHYSPGHPNDKDSKDDNELPFKSKDSLIHIDNPIQPTQPTLEKTFFPLASEIRIGSTEAIHGKAFFSIFHPPRSC
jgi:hypothetical protein